MEFNEWPGGEADVPATLVCEEDILVRPSDLCPGDRPDGLGLVAEAATLMDVFAAQRYQRIHAWHREALAALTDPDQARGGSAEIAARSARLELAVVLRVTENTAGMLICRAEALVHRYQATLDALAGGRVTDRHVQLIVDTLETVDESLRLLLESDALALAEELPAGTFARALRRRVEAIQAATLTERHTRALTGRRVVVEPAEDGMAWLSALIPEVEARAIHSRLTAMGQVIAAHPDETRTLDQVRADVLGDLLIDGRTDAIPAAARGIRAQVVVTVPALSLMDGRPDRMAETASVEGVGPVTVDRARELCGGETEWMRILTHPETGMVLSVGRDRYRPPPQLRRLVRWRAERCMAPGCGIPASRCQLDHTIAWEHGGPTDLTNLNPLCRGHHTIKHHGGWQVTPTGDGGLHWRSPSGRSYTTRPERRVPAFQPTLEAGPPPF